MKIEIITIGNELLEGRIVNTNTQYICQRLYQAGYLVSQQSSVLDLEADLKEKIESSLKMFDVVICSGGLGPTQDDITLEVVSKIFNCSLKTDPQLLGRLRKMFGKKLNDSSILASATVPTKAELLLDHCGMSPGFLFKKGKKRLILLPGVPHEFRHLVDHEVISYLKKYSPPILKEYQKVIHFCLVPESEIAPWIDFLIKKYPQVSFGIYPHLGTLSVHAKMKGKQLTDVQKTLNACLSFLKKKYPKKHFKGSFKSIEQALHHFFIEKKLTLSFAESCSGGSLCLSFTEQPDASKYLKGSLVSYSNQSKHEILKVKSSTLSKPGAVSLECANEMALGALKLFKTDLSISMTGIAGPLGGTRQKPVGTVFAAIAAHGKIIGHFHFENSGDRKTIMKRSVNNILAQLWIMRDNI